MIGPKGPAPDSLGLRGMRAGGLHVQFNGSKAARSPIAPRAFCCG